MSTVVPDGNKCLEPCPLANMSLLLYWHNLQNLIFERYSQEKVNDLRFLMGRGRRDLFQGLDLHVFDLRQHLRHLPFGIF